MFDAGLTMNPAFPFLGATPDSKVFDPTAESPYGLRELKCPFSNKYDTLEQAAFGALFYLEKVLLALSSNKITILAIMHKSWAN